MRTFRDRDGSDVWYALAVVIEMYNFHTLPFSTILWTQPEVLCTSERLGEIKGFAHCKTALTLKLRGRCEFDLLFYNSQSQANWSRKNGRALPAVRGEISNTEI